MLMLVEAFVPELAVEALDVRVLDGPPRPDEAQRDAVLIRPGIEDAAGKLGPVVDHDERGQSDRRR